MDCGFYYAKIGGLFSKTTREGVSAYVGRRSSNGRPETDGRERERGADGQNRSFRGGAPLPTTRSSPARVEQDLWATIR